MDIVPLTLVISLCLTFTFIVFFAREQTRRRFSSSETESLLPLLDEKPAAAIPATGPEFVIDMSKARTRCKNHHECPRAGNCEHKDHPHSAYPEAHA